MKTSESIKSIAGALKKFQASTPKIIKDQTAEIGKYSYKYADLSSIWDAIRGNLADAKLSVLQSPTTLGAGDAGLTTIIMHDESGEWISDTMRLAMQRDDAQGQGSAITYARRYALCSMLGIVADNDNDAKEHRLASVEQKKLLMDEFQKKSEELGGGVDMINFFTQVAGKHPSRILEDEVQGVVELIRGYKV